MMINFPTTVIDDYFEDPHGVYKLAQSDKITWFRSGNGAWPGVRSQPIHELDNAFFTYMMKKFLYTFYTHDNLMKSNFSFEATSFFQRIEGDWSTGWIHSDHPDICTKIIYLTPNANPESGTSIYSKKSLNTESKWEDIKQAYYLGKISKEEAEIARIKNNEGFVEETFVANKFNRAIAFDSHLWHGAKDLNNTEERLTIVTFIHSIVIDSKPISRMRQVQLFRDSEQPKLDIV